jgi:hypothetical protein
MWLSSQLPRWVVMSPFDRAFGAIVSPSAKLDLYTTGTFGEDLGKSKR